MKVGAVDTFPDAALRDGRFELRVLDESGVTDRYVAWLNDPEVNGFIEVRFTPQTRASAAEFVRSFAGATDKYLWGIHDVDGPFVGTVSLYGIDRIHGTAHFGLFVGDRASWGAGAASAAIRLVMRVAFERLHLRRLTAGTYARNHAMNFTMKRLGFRREGVLKDALVVRPGEVCDGYLWALLASEWRVAAGHEDSHA